MKNWVRSVRAAVLLALSWAMVWAPLAVLTGLIVDPDGSMDEMWVAIGAYPGFLCGAIFFALLRSAAARRFGELPLARIGARGAVAGLLVGAFPLAVGTPNAEWPLLGVVVIGAITLLSTASAVVSAWLFRYRAQHRTPAGARPAS